MSAIKFDWTKLQNPRNWPYKIALRILITSDPGRKEEIEANLSLSEADVQKTQVPSPDDGNGEQYVNSIKFYMFANEKNINPPAPVMDALFTIIDKQLHERADRDEEWGDDDDDAMVFLTVDYYRLKAENETYREQEIDQEKAHSTLKNGVLTLRLPKLQRDRARKIEVKEH